MTTEHDLRSFGRLVCRVAAGETLSREEACAAYRQVVLDEQPALQQGAFLMAHIARGPTVEELAGAWDALDRYDTAKIAADVPGPVCDIVGTGSDNLKTVNCSTPAALIAAGCGVRVAKKGARLVTGVSGASDLLESFGLDLDAPLAQAEACLREHGLCYLPGEAFLKAGWARLIQSMRFTSAFNIIGPLTRPCPATDRIVIGAYAPAVCDQLVEILAATGMRTVLAPYGMVEGLPPERGMDEFSPCGPTRVALLRGGERSVATLHPADFGIRPAPFEAIASRDSAAGNAEAVLAVLEGACEGPLADFFCINAAAVLVAAGASEDYAAACRRAREAVADGSARRALEHLVTVQRPQEEPV